MSIVRIPPPLRDATGGEPVVTAQGETVGELLDDLVARFPALDGQLRYANVYVDGEDIRVLDQLETPVDATSTVILLPAMAGGAVHAPGRPPLPAGGAGLRGGLTLLAAGCITLGAWPYVECCPARRGLASLASDAPRT